ncbi:MAG TPA: hypothetical protein VIR30_02580 [Nocardioides sp.]
MPRSLSIAGVRLLALAAALLAITGIVVAITRGTESACDAKRDRLVAIEERYGIEGSQSWDDILVLQESSTIAQAYRDAGEREEILEDLAEAGCS